MNVLQNEVSILDEQKKNGQMCLYIQPNMQAGCKVPVATVKCCTNELKCLGYWVEL